MINAFQSKVQSGAVGIRESTVQWFTPWGTHKYIENIEEREDGGTPGFLQVIRTSLALKLKEQMGVENIIAREEELLAYFFGRMKHQKKIGILAGEHKHRLGVLSFNIEGLHHDLAVRILNDRFGIQTRGGCSCAGTYGHYLLELDQQKSSEIMEKVVCGFVEMKPGWVRLSIHPTTTNEEMKFVCDSLISLAQNAQEWKKDYVLDGMHYRHISEKGKPIGLEDSWFQL
ncbi:MAG: aminotransferase class V-fold PLP-dependent enzyme [Flavobacteriaceae bacterium]